MKSLSLQSPHVIIMVGAPGSGKSFFASRFSETFSVPYISWEAIRSVLFHEATYSKEDETIVEDVAMAMLEQLVKTSATLIYEGDSLTQKSRLDLAKMIRKLGYEPLFVWVQIDSASSKARSLKLGMSPAVYDTLERRFTPLKEAEPYVVVSGKHTYASQLKIVLRRLSSARAVAAGNSSRPLKPSLPPARRVRIQ